MGNNADYACPVCGGKGWYADHTDDCDCWLSGGSSTCPIQRPCDNLAGHNDGSIPEED